MDTKIGQVVQLKDRLRCLSNAQRREESFRLMVEMIEVMCEEEFNKTGEYPLMGSSLIKTGRSSPEYMAYKWLFHQRSKSRSSKLTLSELAVIFKLKVRLLSGGKHLSIKEWFAEPERGFRESFKLVLDDTLDCETRAFDSPYTRRKFDLYFSISDQTLVSLFNLQGEILDRILPFAFQIDVDYIIEKGTKTRRWSGWAAVSICNFIGCKWPMVSSDDSETIFCCIEFCKTRGIGNEIVSSFSKIGLDAIAVYRAVSDDLNRKYKPQELASGRL